ncbi:MAG TPA: hypothetical protein VN513_09075 [Gemmatimonadales bacterium]|nr:hypothetical protein [Gemmatimonadales bacterium]
MTKLLLATIAGLTIATPSFAQKAGDGFLFQEPNGSWTFRGGFAVATAHSDIFGQITDQLTLDRADFSSATFGTALAISVSPRNDVVFDASYSNVHRASEFRDWVDNNDRPIQQSTSLRRIPITVGFRHYLTERGRAVGRFAWIPARRALYAEVGLGMMEYKFDQQGDFIDFQTLNVFSDRFVSQSWTPVAQGSLGLDMGLGSFTMLNLEARYTWSHARMSSDFQDFDRIDLSGMSVTAGLSFRIF